MAGISGLTGTPWHTEALRMDENDNRRKRAYCKYYNNKEKTCSRLVSKCCGSSHCPYYEASPEKEERSKAKADESEQKKGLPQKKPVEVSRGNAIVYKPNAAPCFEPARPKKKKGSHTAINASPKLPHTPAKATNTVANSVIIKKTSVVKPAVQQPSKCKELKPVENNNNISNSSNIREECAPSKAEKQSNASIFTPGTYVLHEKYGRGLISRVEVNTVRVQFFHHGFENLNIEDCEKYNLLKREAIQ